MRELLLTLTLLVTTHVHAAPTPSDEDRIEQDINGDDDGTAQLKSHKQKQLGIDEPGELTPPPPPPANAEAAPAAPVRPTEEETPIRIMKQESEATGEHATSASSGEPIFDWSKHKGEQEVEHPFAPKGLLRINKDGTYVYKVHESDQKHAITVHAGPYHPTKLENPDEKGQRGSTFDDNYQNADTPALLVDYEWQLNHLAVGKLGLKLGSGFYIAQGNGHFVGNTNADKTPLEVFTFALIPINIGPVYRLQWYDHQLFVPYVEGGGTLFGFTELRDDNKGPKFGGSVGAYAAGGVAFNLTYFDALSRIQLDREYSINNIFLTVEFREVISLMTRYDFTGNLINAGFLMEY